MSLDMIGISQALAREDIEFVNDIEAEFSDA
jgi:hypothetical protein